MDHGHGHLNYFHRPAFGDHETMALRTLTAGDFFYFIICEDPHEYNFIEIAFGFRPGTYGFTLHLRTHEERMRRG